jgi:hypothetical protein
MWTNEEVPHGSQYSHVADHTRRSKMTWQVTWKGDYASGWCGPMVGCHMAVGKCPMRARDRIFKNNKKGPSDLAESRQIWWPNYNFEKSK